MLSVVLPLRITAATAYLAERLEANLALFGRYEDVECVVVDSASAPRFQDAIARACDRPRCVLVRDPAPQWPFAPGLARNVGAQRASAAHLLFYDVDLCCQESFVPRVLAWVEGRREATDFLMIPCLYLTAAATAELCFTGAPVDLAPHLHSTLRGDNDLVTHVAVSTSTIAVSRQHFFAIGGNHTSYIGHGAEDFDLLHRLTSFHPIGRRPPDYYDNVKERFPGDYRGFRDYWARYALPHLFDGLYTAHLWHPRPLHQVYFRRRQANEGQLQTLMRRHDRSPPPSALPAPWSTSDAPLVPLRDFIADLQARHGFDPAQHPGLFRWNEAATPARGTARTKLRKLVLRPRAFFADARYRPLRALRHMFPR